MIRQTLLCASLVGLLTVTPLATAQKLYKVIDENGKISYQDKPPVEQNTEVQERHINHKVMKLRQTAPEKGSADAKAAALDPDSAEALSLGDPDANYQPESADAGPGGDNYDDEESSPGRRAYREDPGNLTKQKRAPATPPKKERKLTAEELNDIARKGY